MAVAGGTVNKLLIYYNEIKFINFAGGEFRAVCLSIQQELRAAEIWGRQLKAPHC